MCRVLTIAAAPTNGNRHTGPVGALVLLAVTVAGGPVLVVLAFVATRALVRGGGRPAVAGAALAVVLLTLAAYLALGLGTASAYPDMRCSDHLPPGFGEGSWTQGSGVWPPGLECRFLSSDGVESTYRDGFDVVWVAVAMTSVFAAAMGLVVVTVRYREGTVHFSS